MKIIHCGFQAILSYDCRESTWKKGRCLYNAGHIGNVREEVMDQSSTIFGSCLPQTSIHKPNYQLKIELGRNRTFEVGNCTCKAGITGYCKHMAALIIYVNEFEDVSCTNQQQQWGIPTVKEGYSKGKKICEMFPTSTSAVIVPKYTIEMIMEKFPGINCALETTIQAEKQCETTCEVRMVMSDLIVEVCKLELRKLLVTLMNRRPEHLELCAYEAENVRGIIRLRRLKSCLPSLEKSYFEANIRVTLQQIIDHACATVSQSSCKLWHILRRTRISSSITHRIVTRRDDFEKLAAQLVNNKFSGNEATKYGSKLENAARSSYQFKNNVQVMMCGVVINEIHPWLCCSPDGVILSPEPVLLEIKCPHSRRGQKLVDRETMKSFVPYIYYENNAWHLKRRHQYYSQIQFSLFTLKLQTCMLYVYSAVDHVQVEITIDKPFLEEYFPKLEMFYYKYFLKIVMNKYK